MKKLLVLLCTITVTTISVTNTVTTISVTNIVSCNINSTSEGNWPNPKPHPKPQPDPKLTTISDYFQDYTQHALNIVLDQDTRNNFDSDDMSQSDSQMLYFGLEADIYNEYALGLYDIYNIVKINDEDNSTDQKLITALKILKKIIKIIL